MKTWPMKTLLLKPIGAALLAASALTLSGCMGDDYGYGGGVSLGYGGGYYGGDPYWGWNDGYYYPGSGYYIYDRGGRRYSWNDNQRRYWEGRRGSRPGRENWAGFRGNGGTAGDSNWQQRREAWRSQNQGLTDDQRQARREAWQSRRQQSQGQGVQGLTDDQRQQRREAWQAQRQSSGSTGAPAWRGRAGRSRDGN